MAVRIMDKGETLNCIGVDLSWEGPAQRGKKRGSLHTWLNPSQVQRVVPIITMSDFPRQGLFRLEKLLM
jgi:hypothetical protein